MINKPDDEQRATSNEQRFLAFDLGASSGRAVLGILDDGKLKLEEIHRFSNGPLEQGDSLRWDTEAIFQEMKQGLKAYAEKYGPELDGISVDSWGVDYLLLGKDGRALGLPYNYRDKRTDGVPEQVFSVVSREKVFAQTGNQDIAINTLYQLYSARDSEELRSADKMLLIADYFNYLLCGEMKGEYSLVSTSQMYNSQEGRWAEDLLKELRIPTNILPDIIPPGTIIGKLRPELAEECGIAKETQVIASASHDTACAVAATPLQPGWAYVSSGTWALIGVELDKPLINDDVLQANFTNEGGAEDTIRFLKIAAGLWPLQCCQKKWGISFDEITALAEGAKPFAARLDLDDPRFVNPEDMEAEILADCAENGQQLENERGAIARCIMESLAFKYRSVIESIEKLTGSEVKGLNIVGGGVKNKLLCQLAANAIQRPVKAGPIEATSIGNVLLQAKARGAITTMKELRGVVVDSFVPAIYEPKEIAAWDKAYERFREEDSG